MKILFNLLILKILTFFLFAFFVYEFGKGNLDVPLKHAVEYYFGLKGFEAKVTNLQIIDDKIKIESIQARKNSVTFILENVSVDYNFHINYKKSRLVCDIAIDHLRGITEKNQEFLSSKLSFSYENYFLKRKSRSIINLENIYYQDAFISSDTPITLQNGKASIINFSSKNKIQSSVDVNFNNNNIANIHKITDGENIGGKVSVKNIPITLYKPLYYLYPTDDLLIFLNGFIQEGLIEVAEFNINQAVPDDIQGYAKINNLKFFYHEDLPPLTNMQIDISQKGLLTEFKVNSAKSTDLTLSNGLILMDWKGHDDTMLFVTAKAQGPAKALADLIPLSAHKNLLEANIDLTKITGNTDIDIKIDIPLKPETPDIYNITANIPNSDLSIFKNQVNLKGANLLGEYDGSTLQLKGKGKINEFDSEINFIQNFVSDSSFDHKLNIVADLAINAATKKAKKIGFVTLKNGQAKLDFEYINIKGEGKISARSDLKNLDLYFDKLGIHKNKGESANFVLKGGMETPVKGNINFSLNGANNLDINGNILINNNISEIIFDKLNHRETKLGVEILSNKDLIDINIRGKTLDLSNADMFQFLEKERDSGATIMQLSVDKVKLKNDIELDDLKLKFECNELKCHKGNINANIGSKEIAMQLQEEDKFEKWVIESGNAGAMLLGLGMYEDMRAGTMSLIIKTSRKEVRAGEIIPVLNGYFEFNRFVLHDAPSLSKLVSVVSLPGFVGMIRGNKDIIFSKMTGKFSFQEGILKILDSEAVGPYFDFTMHGNIDVAQRTMELKGNVNPALYGASAVVGSIPIIGRIFTGDRTHRGVMSAPFVMKDKY